jgi:hypothetical protein
MPHDRPDSSADHPLGLTVYDLPDPQAVAQADERRAAQGRWRMLLVLLVCAAPVIASYFTYYVIRPEARRNHGELIQPTRALPEMPTRTLQGAEGLLTALKGQWLLVSVSSGACDERCQQHLYLQRQILTGLGRERDRTDWVWLIDDDLPVPAAIEPGLAEAVVLRVPRELLSQWLSPLPGKSLSDHWFLVDPQGEWMMRFGPDIDAKQATLVKKDLERLLRAAAGWDKAGR